ncbi:MAG: CotH kinase family protein [Bacteroidaceae bacterium]|nr:CotH kinase family protein [Bacteroidaceae bacterium]
MRRFILLCILTLSACALAVAQSDTVFIELTDSSTMIFPRAYIEQWDEDDTDIRLHLAGDTTLTIVKAAVLSQSDTYNRERPAFESFKFNNKFNDQLFTDAEGQIDQSTGEITASVGCIGKRLTPSFKVPEGAKAYIDGRLQYSKQSRLRFEQPVHYTVAYPKQYIYRCEKVKDEVWSEPGNEGEEPTLVSPAEYRKGFMPFGRDYVVRVDFLSDHSTTEYQVPRIDITFDDGESWNAWTYIGRYGKTYYEEATIRIDGGGVFPDMEETPMLIRGRGNSSWGYGSDSKNPYRLKFYEKQKPLGMKSGRSWVLLSNKQTGSMTTNALAMKVADMVGTAGCNHIVPVELYVNGHYRGSYNFTEKTGFHNNSIDLEDETNAVMLELDSYYDEPYKFRDKNYRLYVNLKEPDFEEMLQDSLITQEEADERFQQIQDAFNTFTLAVKKDYDTALLDVDAMVRAMLVTDLVRNEELMHPKSWFIYNADITADSLWTLGPVWDFDWSFGYERSNPHSYFISEASSDLFQYMNSSNVGFPFFKQLLRGSDVAKKAYYRLWTEFMTSGKLDELIEYCDDYFQYAEPSLVHNQNGVTNEEYNWWTGTTTKSTGWGDGKNYATVTTRAKTWLRKRAEYIYKRLTVYDLSDDVIELPEELYGQPDRIDVGRVMQRPVDVYNINGMMVRRSVPYGQFHLGLAPGIYIVDGKKVAIR